jgi:hypothetical protein
MLQELKGNDMEQNYTFSLSRWHKVAERLSREYTETVGQVRNAYTNTSVPAWLGESQEAELKAHAEGAEQKLEWAFLLQDGIAAIRRALGEANATQGVTGELADHDRLARRLKVLTDLLAVQSAEMVGIDQLKLVPERLSTESDRYDRRQGIRIRLMDEATRRRIQDRQEQVRVEYYALADRISEKNRSPLTLALPVEVARAAGF